MRLQRREERCPKCGYEYLYDPSTTGPSCPRCRGADEDVDHRGPLTVPTRPVGSTDPAPEPDLPVPWARYEEGGWYWLWAHPPGQSSIPPRDPRVPLVTCAIDLDQSPHPLDTHAGEQCREPKHLQRWVVP